MNCSQREGHPSGSIMQMKGGTKLEVGVGCEGSGTSTLLFTMDNITRDRNYILLKGHVNLIKIYIK